MAKQTLEEILIQMWEGSRNIGFMGKLNDDEYVGYITAMSMANEPKINKLGIGLDGVLNAVKKLRSEGGI